MHLLSFYQVSSWTVPIEAKNHHCELGIHREKWQIPALNKWDDTLPGILQPFSRSFESSSGRQGRNELRREAKMIVSLKTPSFLAQAKPTATPCLPCLISPRLFLCHSDSLTAFVGSAFRKNPNKSYTAL